MQQAVIFLSLHSKPHARILCANKMSITSLSAMENDATGRSIQNSKYQLISQPDLDNFQLQCYNKCFWRPVATRLQRSNSNVLRYWSTASSTILCTAADRSTA